MKLFEKIDKYIQNTKIKEKIAIIHSDLFTFGKESLKYKNNIIGKIFVESKIKTLCLPSFSYYKKKDVFSKKDTAFKMGSLPNFAIKNNIGYRINNPVHSYIIIGEDKFGFKKSIINRSFGRKTVFDKFYKSKALWCNLGCDVNKGFTIIHHAEVLASVNYRKWINISKKIQINKKIKEINYEYYARKSGIKIDFRKGVNFLIKKNVLFKDQINNKDVFYGNSKEIIDVLVFKLKKDNFFLVK